MKQVKNNRGRTNFATDVVLLVILSILVIFHLLILVRVIPFDLIWGGKLKVASQMYLFEAASVIINSVMIIIVARNAGFIKAGIHPLIIRGGLWVMFLLFMLNTIGNFNSENQFEKNVFTPTTLLLSLLCFKLILTKKT